MMHKSATALAATLLAGSAAAAWEDWSSSSSLVVDPVDPTTSESTWADWTTTTSLEVDPVDPATSTTVYSSWADWTTTTSTTPHCGPTTTSTVVTGTNTVNGKVYSYTKPITIDTCPTTTSTTSAEHTWGDWTTSTTTTADCGTTTSTFVVTATFSDKVVSITKTKTIDTCPSSTTPVSPESPTTTSAHTWGDWPVTVDPVDEEDCSIVTLTYTGTPVWLPKGVSTFDGWTLSTAVDPVTPAPASSTWADWCGPTTTTTVVTGTNTVNSKVYSYTKTVTVYPEDCTSTTTTTTTTESTWADWTSTSSPVVDPATPTTTASTWADWTSSSSAEEPTKATTTTTTTVTPPKPTATCPSDNGKLVEGGGSCSCEFEIFCGVRTNPTADTLFWEKTEGELVDSLAECNALCDANDKCEATLWVDDASKADYHHCWQISDVPAPSGEGYAQISYKKTCSGKCTESYSKK